MPNYIQKQLVKYGHNVPKRTQYCPYEPAAVQYGQKLQEVPVKEQSKLLDKEGKLSVQQVVSSFFVLREGSGHDNITCPKFNRSRKFQTNILYYGTSETASRLYAY